MMENKKSFLLFCDIIETVSKLPDDEAGKLFKHILQYVNDKNPVIENNLLLEIAFEPIKQSLKRNLEQWEKERKQRSEAGKAGMEARWKKDNSVIPPITKDNSVIPPITKITDSVSNSNSENGIDSDKNVIKANAFVNFSLKELYDYLQKDKSNSQAIECYWNLFASKYKIPTISKINDGRRKKLKTRSKEDLFDITKILTAAKDQKWLLEQTFFTFDWMIESESNYIKVLEGNYKEKPKEAEKLEFRIG